MESKFKTFDKVLMRRRNTPASVWQPFFFSYEGQTTYCMVGGACYDKSIHELLPFEGNESLIGTNIPVVTKPTKGEFCIFSDSADRLREGVGVVDILDSMGDHSFKTVSDEEFIFCIPFELFKTIDTRRGRDEAILYIQDGQLKHARGNCL